MPQSCPKYHKVTQRQYIIETPNRLLALEKKDLAQVIPFRSGLKIKEIPERCFKKHPASKD